MRKAVVGLAVLGVLVWTATASAESPRERTDYIVKPGQTRTFVCASGYDNLVLFEERTIRVKGGPYLWIRTYKARIGTALVVTRYPRVIVYEASSDWRIVRNAGRRTIIYRNSCIKS